MNKMPLSSSASEQDTPSKQPARGEKRESSFSKVFSFSLLAFFALQIIVGVAVIVLFIGNEMSLMQQQNVKNELSVRSQRLAAYLEDRLLILGDYAALPVLIAGVMQSSEHLANTVDMLESLPFLESDAYFMVQDFEGEIIYAPEPFTNMAMTSPTSIESFKQLMDGQLERSVEIFTLSEWAGDVYWKLSVPIKYHDLSEGVLSAIFPIRMKTIFPEVEGKVRIVLEFDGKKVASMGSVPEPTLGVDTEIGFHGLQLRQEVCKQAVYERIEYLVFVLVTFLVIGTVVLMVVVQRLGKRLFIVPHERLQATSDQLEREVQIRTADLIKRTTQLSVEIRERREAEFESRQQGQMVSALLEGIGAAFFIVNPATNRIVQSNKFVEKMFGITPEQLTQGSCSSLFSQFSQSMAEFSCPKSIGKDKYTEGVAQHVDGSTFPVSRYLVPMEIRGEKHIGVIMIDITERKNLERRLYVAQKLESVGELASGIAHEINTPIQYIGDSIRFVEEAFDDVVKILEAQKQLSELVRIAGTLPESIRLIDNLEEEADLDFVLEEVPKACVRALEGTDRVAAIVRAMKNFAHPGTGEMTPVDINSALENTIVVSKNEWKCVAGIVKDFHPIPLVRCLPGDINQVLLNILVNAAHAIGDVVGSSGEKGTITLSTRSLDDEVEIRIADSGSGIPPEIREKIFDPFFTTKEVGRGTGQGLAIVHDIIVERHGGTIDMESEVGVGTTFIITLPVMTGGNGSDEA